ncbi:MAG: hypothetical protein AAFX03_07200 [Pseudomonadota bacterium]
MRYIWLLLSLAALPWRASADIQIQAEYHAPTNLFAVMDEAAYWYPGFNEPAHRDAWTERFGWSPEDQAMADQYQLYRQRTFDDSDQADDAARFEQDGIFVARSSTSADADPLAKHFFASETIDDALASLEAITSVEDAKMLRGFYGHFEPKWRILLEESDAFAAQTATLQNDLADDRAGAFLERLSAFYGVDPDLEFTVRLVWWPPINRTFAYVKGETFLLYRHPIRHAEERDRADITVHEAVHYLSAFQPSEQKHALSAAFLEICPADISSNRYDLLEEPLAIAWGQLAFAKYGKGEPVDPSLQYYSRALPEIMGRLAWLHIDAIYESDATILDGVIENIARDCAALLDVRTSLTPKSGALD